MLKLKCDYTSKANTVIYIEGTQLSGEKFQEIRRVEFALDDLPETILANCTAYGLRAILADRTSDAKKLGVNKLDWMSEVYAKFENGEWTAKREAKGTVDLAMAQVVADLKACELVAAIAALKATDKAWRDAFAERYAEEISAVRASQAASVDLTDL